MNTSNDGGELLYIGTKKSFVTVFNHDNKKVKTYKIDSKTSKDYKIKQIEDLPKEVVDVRNHIYYVMTS